MKILLIDKHNKIITKGTNKKGALNIINKIINNTNSNKTHTKNNDKKFLILFIIVILLFNAIEKFDFFFRWFCVLVILFLDLLP